MKKLKNPRQVTLLIPGRINFADGKGAEQARKDFKKDAGDELTFCTAPNGKNLTNGGSETVNNHTEPTNEPRICGYIPPAKKDVVSERARAATRKACRARSSSPAKGRIPARHAAATAVRPRLRGQVRELHGLLRPVSEAGQADPGDDGPEQPASRCPRRSTRPRGMTPSTCSP